MPRTGSLATEAALLSPVALLAITTPPAVPAGGSAAARPGRGR